MIVYKTVLFDNLPKFKDIKLPKGSTILSFGMQQKNFCIWWLTDPKVLESEKWEIIVIGTGMDFGEEKFCVNDTYTFIGTTFIDNGLYVAHCFAKKVY